MKSKCSFILKASTALVLALLMLFGTVMTSVATVVDNLADTSAESENITDTGANMDLAEIGSSRTAYKIRGDVPGWDSSTTMTVSTGGYYSVYQYTSTANASKYFCIYNGDNKSDISVITDGFWGSGGYTDSDGTNNIHANGSKQGEFYIWTKTAHTVYICVYYPNTELNATSTPEVVAYSSKPSDTATYYLYNNFANGTTFVNTSLGTTSGTNWDTKTYSTNISLPTASHDYSFKIYKKFGSSYTNKGDNWYGNTDSITETISGRSFKTTENTSGNTTITSCAAANQSYTFSVTDDNWHDDSSYEQVTLAVTYPTLYTVTFNKNGHGTAPTPQSVVSGGKATNPGTLTATGWTHDGKWYTSSDCTTEWNFSTGTITSDKTLYAKWTPNTYSVALDDNGGSGGSGSVTATYGSNIPNVTVPTRTGYTFGGYYSGSTEYINASGVGVRAWDKANNTTTLTAKWTEVTGGVKVSAYTDSVESSTGGKVKNGTSGTEQSTFNITVGISTKATVVSATPTSGYTFEGWETGGTNASHVKIYTDSNCTTPYVKSTHGALATVYVKTDGASGLTNANAEVRALFESAKYTITNSGAYHKTGSADYVSGTTGGTFTVSNTGSLTYNTNLTLTATAADGYAVEGIYWSTDGTTWTKVETTDTTTNGIITESINDSFKVINNYRLKANFVQVLKLSAFDSYEKNNNQVTFVTAPPKSITIKHTDAQGTDTTYTYSYDGTKPKGNPDSPDVTGTKPSALPIESGKYGQGNYIQYYAGDEITLTYSAMASSEILKGVFYNNSENFYVNKPTTEQFVQHDYAAEHTLYRNNAYYTDATGTYPGVTVDNDTHSIKFTGTQDYKNIDVEIATKRKVYFSDYTNTVITSKNVDDYYYDGEDFSVEGDQLKVAAAKSDTQTNTIDATKIKFYKANSDGTKGVEVDKTTLGITITGSTSSSTQETPSALVFNGNMPAYDLYIDLNMENSYTIKLGSIIVSDIMASKTILGEVADITIKDGSTTLLTSPSDSKVTSTSANVQTGKTIAFNSSWKTGWDPYYMFVGWYWGDETAPDYDKGFISDKVSLSYVPKKGGVIWAVGTRDLFINGTSYITGKNTNWNMVNNVQTNLPMKFDATYKSGNTVGRYYWEITDTMFAAAGNKFTANVNNSNGYWINNGSSGAAKTNWTAEGNSWFRIYDTETNDTNMNYWKDADGSQTTANGVTYGKAKDGDQSDDAGKKKNGLGYINFTPANGYNSPIRIYAYPDKHIEVVATQTYSNLYVSNGYDVGNTKKTQAVTVEPVVNGNVVASGATGYFSVGKGTKYSPDVEGEVYKYTPAKKSATVRITKPSTATENVVAFFIYDIDNKTVRAEKNITKSGNNYYMDLTLASSQQNLYIVPIVEENAANVTITFDATQLNRKQWGDIVTAYAWYQNNGGSALGGYPGQPMIPSDDMSTWTTKFVGTKGSNELEGITFSNYIDGIHSWLGCEGVMGTVTYSDTSVYGGLGDYTAITGGIINTYNAIKSGNSNEYSRANFKAQTYDYREPIALYERFKDTDDVTISFAMKDGNTSLLSWRHTELLYEGSGAYPASSTSKTPRNILNLPSGWGSLRWEYLTNAKGDKYIDMNGANIATKPTASFYVAAKGATIYTNSEMKTIFSGGKNYQQKGVDSATTKDLRWTDTVTYGGATGVSMNYAVEWYVYDAQGNYITTVLSAGIADLASDNSGDSYIGKILEDMGYAVDGKSVAICYDKPRYMYWDDPKNDGPVGNGTDATTGTAKHINTGDGFDVYRFTGQWNAAAHTDTVKVNVGVGMMTDSGEVLASSNTAPYGNATASYDTTKGDTSKYGSMVDDDGNLVTQTASDGSYVQTAVGDAVNNPVKLNATSTNFIGWYYYDANTGEFTKATYTSSENFYPNYTNKDVTYYAIYRAAAVYNYIYQGREGERIYSAAGEDLLDAEMADNKVIYANHSEDILAKLPVGIGIFKKNIDFSAANAASWSKNNDTQYILKLSGFSVTSSEYTLTAHYKDASGDLVTITDSAVYNGKAINLTTGLYHDSKNNLKPGGTAVTSYKSGFIGWYEYDASTNKVGELLSTQANYGMRLTKNQDIIAQYEDDGKTLPSDSWRAFIDENEVNKELTTKDSGVFYNDTIVRIRNGSDVKAELPTGAKIGVIVVCNNKTTETINGYTEAQLTTLATSVAPGKTMGTKKGLSITNMQATGQTSFNRTDIAVRADYAKNLGANYCVYAYIFDGSNYHFSAPSEVKTYE